MSVEMLDVRVVIEVGVTSVLGRMWQIVGM